MRTAEGKPSVRVDVLGSLQLTVDGVAVQVRGPKRRALLALLAVAEGRVVTVDHLMDDLWPSELPESARATLHSHVSRLRGHLGSAEPRLATMDRGYRLVLGDAELDVARARSLLVQGRDEAQRDAVAACELLRAAHRLWRGPVLAGLTDVQSLATSATALEQLRRDVTDQLITCAIQAGRTAPGQLDGVVAMADEALAAEPLREPAALLLMQALAATGRAAEALETGREYRRRLAEETGLDPSPALNELERVIAGGGGGVERTRAPSAAPFIPSVTQPVTTLIGREAQVAAVQRLLETERLVTLVGPGGVGKTRVALEVAWQAEAAVVLELAAVTDPTAIAHALAAALDLQAVQGDVLAACVAVLRAGPVLLVVDNCEHLLDAVRDLVARLLTACLGLTMLATSREPLGLVAECRSQLAPLALPSPEQLADPGGSLQRVPAVAVFLDRAARVRPGFSPGSDEVRLIAEVVRRLDGIPLAIELAAGRLSTFSLKDLHDRLDRRLDLLGSSRPSIEARHRTLRATVEWSYQLLTHDEQRLFRHLAVFVDGVDLSTAEEISVDLGMDRDGGDPATALAHLVDASMINVTFDGTTRFRMLETLRSFGVDRLDSAGEAARARERLLHWAVGLTQWIEATLATDREPDADAALRRELPNLRAAWHLARQLKAFDAAAAIVIALRAASGWRELIEIRGWVDELVDDPACTGHPRAAAVLGTAATAYHRGDNARADRLARAGLQLVADVDGKWRCLFALSLADLGRGAFDASVEHSLDAAAVATQPAENLGVAALAATYAGDLTHARSLSDRMANLAASPTSRAFAAYTAAEIDSAAERFESAQDNYALAIELAKSSGATFLAGIATVGLVTVLTERGHITEALRGYRGVIGYFAQTGNWTHLWATLRNLADLLRSLGDHEPAALLDATGAQDEPPAHSREAALQIAQQAIARNLAAAPS